MRCKAPFWRQRGRAHIKTRKRGIHVWIHASKFRHVSHVALQFDDVNPEFVWNTRHAKFEFKTLNKENRQGRSGQSCYYFCREYEWEFSINRESSTNVDRPSPGLGHNYKNIKPPKSESSLHTSRLCFFTTTPGIHNISIIHFPMHGRLPLLWWSEVAPENWTEGIVKSKPERRSRSCPIKTDGNSVPNSRPKLGWKHLKA